MHYDCCITGHSVCCRPYRGTYLDDAVCLLMGRKDPLLLLSSRNVRDTLFSLSPENGLTCPFRSEIVEIFYRSV